MENQNKQQKPLQETKDKEELIWYVDENDNELGSTTRQEMRNKNLIHRVTNIFLLNSEDKFWVHKRTMTKAWAPGHYDIAFGGVVGYNESYQYNAVRELEEEAGSKSNVTEHFKVYYEHPTSKSWGMIYTARDNGPLTLQESEVESVELMSRQEIEERSKYQQFAPDSLNAFNKLFEKVDKGEIKL